MNAEELRNWRNALSAEGKVIADEVAVQVLFGAKDIHEMTLLPELRDEITRRTTALWDGKTWSHPEPISVGGRVLRWEWHRKPGTQGEQDWGVRRCLCCGTGNVVHHDYTTNLLVCLNCGAKGE